MEPGSVTLDRDSFRALASEVRVEVLKQLEARRMTVTDLSHAMNLAKPTLLDHLDRLVTAGLISKVDEGRKWIYYDLTRKGRHILHPHQVKILISLALSIALVSAGLVATLAATTLGPPDGVAGPAADTGSLGGEQGDRGAFAEEAGSPVAWGVALVAAGVAFLGLALWYRHASRHLIESIRTQLATTR